MCIETASRDSSTNDFPYEFESLSRSVSTASMPSSPRRSSSRNSSSMNSTGFPVRRTDSRSSISGPQRSQSEKVAFQDIQGLCSYFLQDLGGTGSVEKEENDSLFTTTNHEPLPLPTIASSISTKPPGLHRLPSYGSAFKPSYLYTPDDQEKVESLIGLSSLSQSSDEEPKEDEGEKIGIKGKVEDIKETTTTTTTTTSSGRQYVPYNSSSRLLKWKPDSDDMELFDCVVAMLKVYTLGLKELIGVRQVLRNKFGDDWVNNYNKKLSSKSLLWRCATNENRLIDVLKARSKKFTLVVKNETSMFYLSRPGVVPEGFSMWVPSSSSSNEDGGKAFDSGAKSHRSHSSMPSRKSIDEVRDVNYLSQPSWRQGSKYNTAEFNININAAETIINNETGGRALSPCRQILTTTAAVHHSKIRL